MALPQQEEAVVPVVSSVGTIAFPVVLEVAVQEGETIYRDRLERLIQVVAVEVGVIVMNRVVLVV
jgi:hypothetical protein